MPCTDPIADQQDEADHERFMEAMACACVRAMQLRGIPFESLDLKLAGVTRTQAKRWWKQHQQKDKKKANV